MVAKERAYLVQAPWVVLFPAGAIVTLVVGVTSSATGCASGSWRARASMPSAPW